MKIRCEIMWWWGWGAGRVVGGGNTKQKENKNNPIDGPSCKNHISASQYLYQIHHFVAV
jgi:hypothetical protein